MLKSPYKVIDTLKRGVGHFNQMLRKLKKFIRWVKYGKITSKVTETAGDGVPAEIEYYDRFGRCIGFWAYGYLEPNSLYKGND